MALCVQYNPSTGKALFNAVTKKAQTVECDEGGPVAEPCEHCAILSTPSVLSVTFDGVLLCDSFCCNFDTTPPSGFHYNKPSFLIDLNDTWELAQVEIPTLQFSAPYCAWEYRIVDAVTMTWYTNSSCSVVDSSETSDIMITVIKGQIFDADIYVYADILHSLGESGIFHHFEAPTSDCVNVSMDNVFGDSGHCCQEIDSNYFWAGYDGDVVVTEVW